MKTFVFESTVFFSYTKHDIPLWMLSIGSGLFLGLRQIESGQEFLGDIT